MDDIPYSRIRVIYALRPHAVGFALRKAGPCYFLQKMAAGGVQYFCCLP